MTLSAPPSDLTFNTYGRRAADTAWRFYALHVRNLDAAHGDGYAQANPTLVAALVTASAQIYAAGRLGSDIFDGFNVSTPTA